MKRIVFFGVVTAGVLMVVQAFADGKISDFRIQDDSATLSGYSLQDIVSSNTLNSTEFVVMSIETTPGKKYQVQGLDDLLHGIWTSIGNSVVADTNSITVSFPRKDAFTFFRVVAMKINETLKEPAQPATSPPTIPSAPPIF